MNQVPLTTMATVKKNRCRAEKKVKVYRKPLQHRTRCPSEEQMQLERPFTKSTALVKEEVHSLDRTLALGMLFHLPKALRTYPDFIDVEIEPKESQGTCLRSLVH